MQLSFFRASHVTCVADLPKALDASEAIWAFVDHDDGWFRHGEAIRVRKKRPGDRGVVVLSESADVVVDELLTANARLVLGAAPLRAIVETNDPRLFRAAVHVLRPFVRALDQLEPAPSLEDALDAQCELYDATEVIDETSDSLGLSDLEELVVERWMRASGDVIDVGCGTGREALAFAQRGMRVTAIDASAPSVKVAQARAAREFPADRVSVRDGDLDTLDLPREAFDSVFFASDVFACIPGSENRERVLRRAAELLRPKGRVFVQAMIAPHRLRAALLDTACGAVARWRGERHERGDRWVVRGPPPVRMFRHGFSNDEAVVGEIERAGLAFVARCGTYVIAEKREDAHDSFASLRSLAREAHAVLTALPHVDRVRREQGPKPAATTLRSEAAHAPRRDARGRARLARAIELCDRVYPFGRGGCYRRALLEIALDSGAASEPLYLGLADPEGHAWLPRAWPVERYPAVFTV